MKNYLKLIGAILLKILLIIIGIFTLGRFGGKDNEKYKEKSEEIMKESEKDKEKIEDIKEDIDDRKKDVDSIDDKFEETDEELEKIDEKFKNKFNMFIVLIIAISLLCPISVYGETSVIDEEIEILQEEVDELDGDDLYIPDNYDDLVEEYKEMAEFALKYREIAYIMRNHAVEYRQAYINEKQSHKLTMDIKERDDNRIKSQNEIINELIEQDFSKFGLFGGINYVPLNPQNTGLMLGGTIEF